MKFLKIILLILLCLKLSACGKSLSQQYYSKPEPIEIAILMPLTGINAKQGKEYDRLIKAGLIDNLKNNIKVTSYDGANEALSSTAMDKIIEQRTKIVLGPLTSSLTKTIAPKAKEHGIIVISMSNDPALADSNLYIFGLAPFEQTKQLIKHFTNEYSKDFYTLLPSTSHSSSVNDVVRQSVVLHDNTFMRAEFYQNDADSMFQSIKNIQDTIDLRSTCSKGIVYLSDDGERLELLYNEMAEQNLGSDALLIGDNRINISNIRSNEIYFTGGAKAYQTPLYERLTELVDQVPLTMHILAYDLGTMVAKNIDNFSYNNFRHNLSKPYDGLSGYVKFVDSVAQRQYDIIKRYQYDHHMGPYNDYSIEYTAIK